MLKHNSKEFRGKKKKWKRESGNLKSQSLQFYFVCVCLRHQNYSKVFQEKKKKTNIRKEETIF